MASSAEKPAIKKPHKTKGLATPTRKGKTFTAKWTAPSTTKTDARRAIGQEVEWYTKVLTGKDAKGKNQYFTGFDSRSNHEVGTGTSSSSHTLKEKYYPENNYKLRQVTIAVANWNWYKNAQTWSDKTTSGKTVTTHSGWSGTKAAGDFVRKTYKFKKPKKPTIEIIYPRETSDTGDTEIQAVITCKNGDKRHRHDTLVNGYRQDSGNTGVRDYKSKWHYASAEGGGTLSSRTFTAETHTYKHRITKPILKPGAKIHFKISATVRGYWGNSDKVTKHYVIRAPYVPQVKKIHVLSGGKELTGDVSTAQTRKYLSKGNGKIMVDFGYKSKADSSDEVKGYDNVRTRFYLERLISDDTVTNSTMAALEGGWETSIDTYIGATSAHLKSGKKDTATMGDVPATIVAKLNGKVYGFRVWYRIRATRQGMTVYSAPVEAKALGIPTPSAENDESAFIYIGNGSDGQTIETVVGWDNPSNKNEMYDDPVYKKDGEWTTVIGYSEYKDAIHSNSLPQEITIDWRTTGNYADYADRDVNPESKRIKWNETAECAIHNLTCGTPYYLWVRRHVELDGLKESNKNSKWHPAPEGYFPFTPTDNPTSIDVRTPSIFVPLDGQSFTVSWTHNATSQQVAWAVYLLALPANYSELITESGSSESSLLLADTIPAKILASGTGATDTANITYSAIQSALTASSVAKNGTTYYYGSLTSGSELYIGVGVSTGGMMVMSYATELGNFRGCNVLPLAVTPDCGIYLDDTIESQPVDVYVFTNDPQSNFTVVATSEGAMNYYPDGDVDQADGDFVWDYYGEYTEWAAREGTTETLPNEASSWSHYVKLSIPEGTEFFHNGEYEFTANTISSVTDLLVSVDATVKVDVDYSRLPQPPGETSRCETNRLSKDNPKVEIYCAPPSDFVSTDRANVYRITPDKAYLIAEDVRFGTVVTDNYPPFSKTANLRYVIATVTKDGVVESREVPYSFKRHGLRFDWGDGKSLELPYNIQMTDEFEKDSEIMAFQDGTVNAYWNPAVTRTMTANSVIIKDVDLYDVETFETVREMGQYPGPILVRAHNGICFAADVKVGGLTDNYDQLTAPVSITATEITLPEQFKSQGYIKFNE